MSCHISFLLTAVVYSTVLVRESKSNPDSLEWACKTFHALNEPSLRNVFVSPLSIRTVLAVAMIGSSGNTKQILTDILKVTNRDGNIHRMVWATNNALGEETQPATVVIVNGCFTRPDINVSPFFASTFHMYYGGNVTRLPFLEKPDEARRAINEYVSAYTARHIPQCLTQDLSTDTAVMLVNAIYFKANWLVPFDQRLTKKGWFYRKGNDAVSTDFMSRPQTDTAHGYSAALQVEMIELPYTDYVYSMYLMFAAPNVDMTSSQFAERMTAYEIGQLMSQMQPTKMTVTMPKFKITYSAALRQLLVKLGGGDIFSETNAADFTNMFESKTNVGIDDILHAARVEVNEEGTTAAGATAVQLSVRAMPMSIVIDRPFEFFIQHRTSRTVLFWGRVDDPSSLQ